MRFTDDEFQEWHRAKLEREFKPRHAQRPLPIATCVCCQNPFGVNEGAVTDEVAICDVCNGD